MEDSRFLSHGLILFLNQTLVAAGNWAYWIFIGKLASTSEIGQATSIYSLVLLTGTLTQLGLEYPILKAGRPLNPSNIVGLALMTELLFAAITIPLIFAIASSDLYHSSLSDHIWVVVAMLMSSAVGFVCRFALLGASKTKAVLIIEVTGTILKFVSGYALVLSGFGVQGILISVLLQMLFVAMGCLLVARSRIALKIVTGIFKQTSDLIRAGLVNAPAKLSRAIVMSLAIVLLASMGTSDSDVGIFYISIMISIVGGTLASSVAFMVIPASSNQGFDLSDKSLRAGLSLTAPIIALLITMPGDVLSLIGTEYKSGESVLLVLAISIFPQALVFNAVSKYNNLNHTKKLVLVGSLQLVSFLISFPLFVPLFGILGAALAILLAYSLSSIPFLLDNRKHPSSLRHICFAGLAVLSGALAAVIVEQIVPLVGSFAELSSSGSAITTILIASVSISGSLLVLLATRTLTISEIIQSIVPIKGKGELSGSS